MTISIKLNLDRPAEIEAFGVFCTSVAAARRAEPPRRSIYDFIGGIDKASNPMWRAHTGFDPASPDGDETVTAQVHADENEDAVLAAEGLRPETIAAEAASAPKRVRGQPSPGKARRTKAEIAEDSQYAGVNDQNSAEYEQAIAEGRPTPGQIAAEAVEDSPEVQAADAADEAAETAAAKVDGKLTLDDVRNALGGYVNKFGMAAAQADGPQLIAKVLGVEHNPAAPKKISDLGDDQVLLKRAVDGVAEMIAKDPFKRAVAA